MNYLGNELIFLEDDRVNQGPDRKDRAVRRNRIENEKVCRPDRYRSEGNHLNHSH